MCRVALICCRLWTILYRFFLSTSPNHSSRPLCEVLVFKGAYSTSIRSKLDFTSKTAKDLQDAASGFQGGRGLRTRQSQFRWALPPVAMPKLQYSLVQKARVDLQIPLAAEVSVDRFRGIHYISLRRQFSCCMPQKGLSDQILYVTTLRVSAASTRVVVA